MPLASHDAHVTAPPLISTIITFSRPLGNSCLFYYFLFTFCFCFLIVCLSPNLTQSLASIVLRYQRWYILFHKRCPSPCCCWIEFTLPRHAWLLLCTIFTFLSIFARFTSSALTHLFLFLCVWCMFLHIRPFLWPDRRVRKGKIYRGQRRVRWTQPTPIHGAAQAADAAFWQVSNARHAAIGLGR